ncbi:MAG: hypothetical protein MUC99_11255 [Anaerolineae bacterium]|jgi:hypothetical protein|nr:hypothetical protein [Anaerolineae bacterium]
MTTRKTFVSLILIVLFSLSAASVQAQTAALINVTQTAFDICNGEQLEGRFALDIFDANNNLLNGSTNINATIFMNTSNGRSYSRVWAYRSGVMQSFAFGKSGPNFVYVDVYAQIGAVVSDTYRYGCDGSITRLGNGNIITGPDARINPNNGDLISALYLATGKDNKPAIRVYDIDANSVGLLRGDYSFSVFEPYIGKPPKTNTVITRVGRTVLIALSTGEFQINVGPDAEGKVHEVILNSMPPTRITFSFFYQR